MGVFVHSFPETGVRFEAEPNNPIKINENSISTVKLKPRNLNMQCTQLIDRMIGWVFNQTETRSVLQV